MRYLLSSSKGNTSKWDSKKCRCPGYLLLLFCSIFPLHREFSYPPCVPGSVYRLKYHPGSGLYPGLSFRCMGSCAGHCLFPGNFSPAYDLLLHTAYPLLKTAKTAPFYPPGRSFQNLTVFPAHLHPAVYYEFRHSDGSGTSESFWRSRHGGICRRR